MADCLFCKIFKKEINSKIVYEDKEIMAFEDINPQAPVHILIIPRKHIESLNDIKEEDEILLGKMFTVAKKLAKEKGISEDGYRTVFNTNKNAGQAVFHLHLHLLGGRKFGWPPG
jgi:histidine triad (HIT) family protein